MRFRPALTASLFLALAPLSPAFADEAEDKLTLAREITEISLDAMNIDKVIDTMWLPIADQSAMQGKPLSDAKKEALSTLYLDTFREPMTALMRGQDKVMAELMSIEELTALRDFYTTDAGRSVMAKMPDVMARQQPEIIAFVQSNMPALMPKVMEILNTPE